MTYKRLRLKMIACQQCTGALLLTVHLVRFLIWPRTQAHQCTSSFSILIF